MHQTGGRQRTPLKIKEDNHNAKDPGEKNQGTPRWLQSRSALDIGENHRRKA